MNWNQFHMHFIGVGGAGMSGLAELFFHLGARVTGSDHHDSDTIQRLKKLGIPIQKGHHPDLIKAADVAVYSSAIQPSNPELLYASVHRIPHIRRAEALAELMRLKRGIAVAGTHGKTTTTSYISHIFMNCDLRPTVVVGGKLVSLDSGAHLGEGDWFVAEADESDGSFLYLSPEVIVVTNIDDDHLDFYHDVENLKKTFYQFASRIPFYGYILYWGDCPHLKTLFAEIPRRVFSYGESQDCHYRIENSEDKTFRLLGPQGEIGFFEPPLPGRHNVWNAAASLVVALRAGIPWQQATRTLRTFSGVERRMQFLGSYQKCLIYTDYAHHPTEIRCTIQAFRDLFPEHKIKVVFQPHRFSRTKRLWKDFLGAFDEADEICVLDIYPAGEPSDPEVSGEKMVEAMEHPSRFYRLKIEEIPESFYASDCVVVFMGAGDIYKKALSFLNQKRGFVPNG